MFCLMPCNYFSAKIWSEIPFCTCYMVSDWLLLIIIFCYITIVNFVVFHRFQFSNELLFNKSISSIESSVQKETAQEMTKDSNTYNSFKVESCQPSTLSVHHFEILQLFQKLQHKNTFKGNALLQSRGIVAPNQVLQLTNIMGKKYIPKST